MLIAFLKYPLWIIIILSLIFLKSFKVDYLKYLFYALILNFYLYMQFILMIQVQLQKYLQMERSCYMNLF